MVIRAAASMLMAVAVDLRAIPARGHVAQRREPFLLVSMKSEPQSSAGVPLIVICRFRPGDYAHARRRARKGQ
jgi:hypothetical protein